MFQTDGMFLVMMVCAVVAACAALIDRSGAAALMPEEASNQIIQGLPAQSAALQLFRRLTMGKAQTRMPALSALPIAYFVNGDNGFKKTTSMSWENVYLNAEEMACIVPIPEAVLDDADFDIWGETLPRIVEAMGIALDAAVFFDVGAPASWPDGVCHAAMDAGNEFVSGSIETNDFADDINSTMALVEADGFDVTGFAGASTLKARLRGLRTSTGEMLFVPNLTAGTPASLYGENLHYSKNGAFDPTEALLIAGDWSNGILGVRQDITTKVLTEAVIQDPDTAAIVYNLAQMDMIALRVTFRIAWAMANPINRMQETKANRYPMAVLRPAGYGE